MIKECHRHIQCIDIRQREVGGWRDYKEFKIRHVTVVLVKVHKVADHNFVNFVFLYVIVFNKVN